MRAFFARRLAVEMRRRQAADAAADNDQIVSFARIFGLAGGIPESAVAQTACAASNDPGWLPRMPVSAGG